MVFIGRVRGSPDGDGHICWDVPIFLLRSVKILNFMILREWIRVIDLGVNSGMGGFLCFLMLMVLLHGQRQLPKVLVICWSRFLGLSLRDWCLIGST